MLSKFVCIGLIPLIFFSCSKENPESYFPDGTEIPAWFRDTSKISLQNKAKQFNIMDYGAVDDSVLVQTTAIQNTIDEAASKGGGIIIIPKGTYLSGALFFKPGTSLYISEGAVLKGLDTIAGYPKIPSRMEGLSLDYFAALINAYGVNNFAIFGKGTIDGNGLKYWKTFWKRRAEKSYVTNLDVSRPRLVFIWNSDNVTLQDVTLKNAGFWTSHYYKCNYLRLSNVKISSPQKPIKAASTDGIDLDICSNVHVKGCTISVADDAIALKGGKGLNADKDTNNGMNQNILVEECRFVHSKTALTCGSESIHNRNIMMRNCYIENSTRLFRMKMRNDTPQKFEYITIENIKGQADIFIHIKPWGQFADIPEGIPMPFSIGKHITMQNIDLKCNVFFDVQTNERNLLSDFVFKDLTIQAEKGEIDKSVINNFQLENVLVNGELVE